MADAAYELKHDPLPRLPAASDAPTPREIADQVRRIAVSERFRNAGPITRMLVFLGEQASTGAGLPVKEYQIATEALERGPDFDPRTDSTVRSLATRLRDRLASYYLREGLSDPVIIDLPRGSYALSAAYRHPVRVVEPPVTPPIPLPRPVVPAGSSASTRRHRSLAAAVLIVLALVGSFLLGRAAHPARSPEIERSFWADALGGRPSLMIYSNPVFVGAGEQGVHLQIPGAVTTGLGFNIYSGTGEVTAVQLLTHQLDAVDVVSDVQRAGLFSWDEALSHNLIFIGGPAQNSPYKQLPQLEHFTLKPPTDAPYPGQAAVHTQNPRGGESSYYVETESVNRGADGTVYAVIALTPGVSPNHKVLILAGTDTYGTEAAARFLCEPESLSSLYQMLHVSMRSRMPSFEALVRVQVRGGVPIDSALVAAHQRRF